ncbi:MAG: nuclear transport factor 2 family protein [Thermodesulfobacteriota bacterium]
MRDHLPSTAELRDRAAIHDVVMRYARAVDRRDFAGVAACFTSDASYSGMLSRRDVADALRSLHTSLGRYDVTQHFMGNQLVEIQGDAARVETYCVAHHRPSAAGQEDDLLIVGVRYHDEMTYRDGAWSIVRRTVTYDWRRHDRGVLRGGAP